MERTASALMSVLRAAKENQLEGRAESQTNSGCVTRNYVSPRKVNTLRRRLGLPTLSVTVGSKGLFHVTEESPTGLTAVSCAPFATVDDVLEWFHGHYSALQSVARTR